MNLFSAMRNSTLTLQMGAAYHSSTEERHEHVVLSCTDSTAWLRFPAQAA